MPGARRADAPESALVQEVRTWDEHFRCRQAEGFRTRRGFDWEKDIRPSVVPLRREVRSKLLGHGGYVERIVAKDQELHEVVERLGPDVRRIHQAATPEQFGRLRSGRKIQGWAATCEAFLSAAEERDDLTRLLARLLAWAADDGDRRCARHLSEALALARTRNEGESEIRSLTVQTAATLSQELRLRRREEARTAVGRGRPSDERRAEAVGLLVNSRLSVAEVARRVGVSRRTLYKWPEFSRARNASRDAEREARREFSERTQPRGQPRPTDQEIGRAPRADGDTAE
ncbi:MAG: helix-turn-helix domain-containing protein [Planctomycetales bacterium]|nr:helix-turn-helix domain-containing protein [Planctomycetales bacterium]